MADLKPEKVKEHASNALKIDNAKLKLADNAMEQIDKQFGKGSIIRLADAKPLAIDAISTGSISFDACLGIGGVPKGRIVEIYGPESSGKTTICLHILDMLKNLGLI